MTQIAAVPALSAPSISPLGRVLDHLFDNRGAVDPVHQMASLDGLTGLEKKAACDELKAAGLLRYEPTGPKLTSMGILLAESRQLALGQPRQQPTASAKPMPSVLLRSLRWVLRKLTPVRSEANRLDWVIVVVLWSVIGFAIVSLSRSNGRIEPLLAFQIGSQTCLLIGTLYIASGVLYHRPPTVFSTVWELQEHVVTVFGDASRHCKIGLLFFFSGTAVDLLDKLKWLERLLPLP